MAWQGKYLWPDERFPETTKMKRDGKFFCCTDHFLIALSEIASDAIKREDADLVAFCQNVMAAPTEEACRLCS